MIGRTAASAAPPRDRPGTAGAGAGPPGEAGPEDAEPLRDAGDVAGFARSDAEFHRAIVTASGNAIADRFYATLSDRQRRMTIGAIATRPERIGVLVREHQGLAGHIADRDADGFTAALTRHLEATHSFLLGR